jgi:hypothetical protein
MNPETSESDTAMPTGGVVVSVQIYLKHTGFQPSVSNKNKGKCKVVPVL